MYAKSSTDVDETEKNPLNGIIMEAIGKEGVYKGKAGYTNYFQHMDKSMAIKGLDIKYLFIYCLFVCLFWFVFLLFISMQTRNMKIVMNKQLLLS